MKLSFEMSKDFNDDQVFNHIMNETIDNRDMYVGLSSREIFQVANGVKVVDANLIDLIPRMVTNGAGFMEIPVGLLSKDAFHSLFESKSFRFKNRDQLLKLIGNGRIVMVWSDKYFLTAVPFIIKNTNPKTVYVNMSSVLKKNENNGFDIDHRKEADAVSLMYTAIITLLYSKDNWVPNVPELKTISLTYSNMMSGVVSSIYKITDPITSAKFKYIFSKLFFIQSFGTEKGSQLMYKVLNNHFEDLLGKNILNNLDALTEQNIDAFDSVSGTLNFVTENIKSPHVKEIPLGVLIESWVRRYGAGSFLAIDYAGYLIYAIIATRFMGSSVSSQTIEKQLPKIAVDCFRLWDEIKII
jgi:hypothetical protein